MRPSLKRRRTALQRISLNHVLRFLTMRVLGVNSFTELYTNWQWF